jgi:hypothetical protein
VNPNQRREIQLRVASYLEQVLLQFFCQNSEILETLAIQVEKMIFLGTYIPDGRSPEGIKQWIEIMDSLEAKYPNSVIISLGDLNCRATALVNLRTNESSPFRNAWIQQSDSWDFHKFQEPTRPSSEGFLNIVFYKDLAKCLQVSFEDEIPSDHKGVLIRIDNCWDVPTSPAPVSVRLKMENINNALRRHLEVRGQFSVRDFAAIMQQERTRCLQSRRSKGRRNYYRQRYYWFQPSNSLLKLKRTMFRAKKSGDITGFNTLRRNYQQLLEHEKRQSFNSYLEETAQSKDIPDE